MVIRLKGVIIATLPPSQNTSFCFDETGGVKSPTGYILGKKTKDTDRLKKQKRKQRK